MRFHFCCWCSRPIDSYCVIAVEISCGSYIILLCFVQTATKPAHAEHKEALALGVHATPTHVVDGVIVAGDESAEWTADAWKQLFDRDKPK